MFLATMVLTALYAIVGGPSNGKTTIIEELKEKGEITSREVSTDYILEQKKLGIEEPWNQDFFQYNILERHLKREKESLALASELNKERVFTDRAILDHYVYLKIRNKANTEEYTKVDSLIKANSVKDHYKAVFFIHPYAGKYECEQTEARHEDNEEMKTLNEMTFEIYRTHCPVFIEVPPHMSPKERAEFVLDKVAALEKSAQTTN